MLHWGVRFGLGDGAACGAWLQTQLVVGWGRDSVLRQAVERKSTLALRPASSTEHFTLCCSCRPVICLSPAPTDC